MDIAYAATREEHPRKPEKGDNAGWDAINNDFVNEIGGMNDLAMTIASGRPIAPWLTSSRRKYDNFLCAQFIGVDFDNENLESDIDIVSQVPLVANHAAMIYTTQSHRKEAQRCRVIFVLDSMEYDPEAHRERTRAVVWALDADPQATDPARMFMPMGGDPARMIVLGHTVETAYVDTIVADYNETHMPRFATGDIGDTNQMIQACIRKAHNGKRNALGYWLAMKMAEGGIEYDEAANAMSVYQAGVEHMGKDRYSLQEALQSLRSAYNRRAK